MSRSIPEPSDREFLSLLILGEVLTKRGEPGPLTRVWRPVGPATPRRPKPKPPVQKDIKPE